ncbi:MAG: class I SAM-dependent methyltransferase [Elusimicrobia bacterium]|nr:class I SAM-dependent methyltransferase [Elusimicrobiota bacterium]
MAIIDKYALYAKAVQTPAADARFFRHLYRDLRGRAPKRLREDFCGTFGVCCEWVKLGPGQTAHGRDLSEEALRYGRERNLSKLTPGQRRRVAVTRQDVLEPGGPSPDLILAQNFSYNVFTKREALKAYFVNCRKSLRRGGVLALDIFGGAGTLKRNVERTDNRNFVFYWEQSGFDPVTHEASCAIHFKPKGRKKVKDVFTYRWRLWTIPEVRELLAEAGFRTSHVYWEGLRGKARLERVWIALILAEK